MPWNSTIAAARRGVQPACCVASSQFAPSALTPDFVAGLVAGHAPVGPPAHEPHAPAEGEAHGEIAVPPGSFLRDELPLLAVGRAPHVARRRFEAVEPTAQDPQAIVEHNFALAIARLPGSPVGDAQPVGRGILGECRR